MEHKGLVRALQFLADNSLQVATLVTDRHNQIVKPEIEHRYDVWHVSKGIYVTLINTCISFTSIHTDRH